MFSKAKYIVFRLFVALLCLPFAQQELELFAIKPLAGEYIIPEKPVLTFNTLWSGDFQEGLNEYYKYIVGLRVILVRIYNQISYSLYGEVHVSNVLVGKDNQLFQDFYIDEYVGKEYVGEKRANEDCFKLKKIQDTLSIKGIHFLVLLCPSKAHFFPEYIPDIYNEYFNKKLPNNYTVYSKALLEHKINLIDFNKWYVEHKNKTPYPLYPQGGIHWSLYGSAIAADTLIENMKRISGSNYSNVRLEGGEIRDSIPKPDRDLCEGMNLLFPIKAYKTAFPVFQLDTTNKIKPKVLTISDSYFGNLSETGFSRSTFSSKSWDWRAFHMAHSEFTDQYIYVNLLDIQKEIEQCEFIMIVCTPPNLKNFGWGFIDKVYGIYYPVRKEVNLEEIAKVKENMRLSADWMKALKQKASLQKIALDSMMTLDAIWVIERNLTSQKKINLEKIADIKNHMKASANWMKSIGEKAIAQKIPLDSMMTLDAIWIIENDQTSQN